MLVETSALADQYPLPSESFLLRFHLCLCVCLSVVLFCLLHTQMYVASVILVLMKSSPISSRLNLLNKKD